MYCGVVIPSWTETRGFPAESIPKGGAPSLDSRFENHATEKLGDWDAIICTAFAKIPKKITAFDQAGDVYVTGARLPAFAPKGVCFAPKGVCKDFDAPSKEARLILRKSHKTELCRQLTN
jgi:hypothetical protein